VHQFCHWLEFFHWFILVQYVRGSPYPEVHKFSQNLEVTFKFYAPDDCNEAGSTPRTQIISRHRIKSIRRSELATRIGVHLNLSRTILNAMYCSHYLDTGEHAVAHLVEALRYKLQVRGFDSRWRHGSFSWTKSFRPIMASWNPQDLHRGYFTYLDYG